MSHFLFLFFLSFWSGAADNTAGWPTEAKTYLSQLPQRQLTLPFVLKQALDHAEVFQSHKAEFLRAEAASYQTQALSDILLTGSHGRLNNENEAFTPFQPIEQSGWNSTLGLSKYFASGTKLSLDTELGRQNSQLSAVAGGAQVDGKVALFNLGFEQDLLSDFFGARFRQLRRADDLQKKSIQSSTLEKIQSSYIDIINLYYSAWLSQQTIRNTKSSLGRQKKLLSIVKRNQKRGTAEEADVLQIENSIVSREVQLQENQMELKRIWEGLVFSLKLPSIFLAVPPETIPMAIDSPLVRSQFLCSNKDFESIKTQSVSYQQAESNFRAAEERLSAAKLQLRPELKFQASYGSNGIDSRSSQSFQEATSFDHPAWSASLVFSMPLQNRKNKAQFLQAKANMIQAKALRNSALENLEANWRQLCSDMRSKLQIKRQTEQIYKRNKRRVVLEDRRFKLGRIRANEWVQAQEDQDQSYLLDQQSAVSLRQTAWQVQELSGDMSLKIQAALKDQGEEGVLP